ncbi:hypothetical protein BO99DRAFT_224544 [Aspergillus violaceofuscus CBS 115571]|uniref:Uncharacterized protein n=1 Tax=Aspergillus violaceofuscus (strain CBS 115571) TaxID=1450538 RepID=A0A2V5IGW3_ASPV1|nr:hypothetical protein BO99DRAFT_224544 [Aspergillus violaceofuscus CBS 115571]
MIHKLASCLTRRESIPSPSNGPSSTKVSRSRSVHTDWNTDPDLFRYTRGRFISNEAHEMAIRHVNLNMDELAKRAAETVGSTLTQCARVENCSIRRFCSQCKTVHRWLVRSPTLTRGGLIIPWLAKWQPWIL